MVREAENGRLELRLPGNPLSGQRGGCIPEAAEASASMVSWSDVVGPIPHGQNDRARAALMKPQPRSGDRLSAPALWNYFPSSGPCLLVVLPSTPEKESKSVRRGAHSGELGQPSERRRRLQCRDHTVLRRAARGQGLRSLMWHQTPI